MTTLTQPLELSLISAPVAAIDRRALSQAWYSALDFRQSATNASFDKLRMTNRLRRTNADKLGTTNRLRMTNFDRLSFDKLRTTRVRGYARDEKRGAHAQNGNVSSSGRATQERRTSSPLAQRIERKLLAARKPQRTSIALDGAQGRVHLMLQGRETRLRVVAICPRSMEARVARALGEARYALARCGIHIDVLAKGGGTCT